MKKFFYILIIVLNFNNLLAIESKIIYKIQNEIITNIDIKNEYNYLLALNKNLKSLPKEKIFNIAKESIIREKIRKVELIRNSIRIDSEIPYLNSLLKNIYLALGLRSIDDFKKHLKINNLEFNTIEEKIRVDALWNVLIIKKYDSKITINLDEIKNKIKNRKIITKSYLLSEIFYEINNKSEIKKKYIEILNSINEVGFNNTVSIYSIADSGKKNGAIGWVNMLSLSKEIRDNILPLSVGDVSPPFLMPGGILILKINDIKEETKKINLDLELKQAILFERNKQLNQFSEIYYKKVKKNLDF